MPDLEMYRDYWRKDIHDIFAPEEPFSQGSGTWGVMGILGIPNRPKDYVFIVTYGQQQAGHEFNEPITVNGIINWQSQPSQDLDEYRIRDFINHDESINSIYLFLRTKKGSKVPYTYLGQLRYLAHDSKSGVGKDPVHFKWRILGWEIDDKTLRRMGLQLR
jgi:hypothetical protein